MRLTCPIQELKKTHTHTHISILSNKINQPLFNVVLFLKNNALIFIFVYG
jgi:hypothetical protein